MKGNHAIATKILALVMAVMLIVGASVAGTLAWLTAQTPEVVNTFTSGQLFEKPDEDFTLWEHKAVDEDKDGRYTLTEEEVQKNTYKILPGVNTPKDPTVDVVELLENGYLYITVADNITKDEDGKPTGLSYEIDDTNWTALSGYEGVWVYSGTEATENVIKASVDSKKSFVVNILKDKEVKVSTNYTPVEGELTLKFNAFMVQATGNGANAAEAWANTYGTTTP